MDVWVYEALERGRCYGWRPTSERRCQQSYFKGIEFYMSNSDDLEPLAGSRSLPRCLGHIFVNKSQSLKSGSMIFVPTCTSACRTEDMTISLMCVHTSNRINIQHVISRSST